MGEGWWDAIADMPYIEHYLFSHIVMHNMTPEQVLQLSKIGVYGDGPEVNFDDQPEPYPLLA